MPCRDDYGPPPPPPDYHRGKLAGMLCEIMAEHEARGDMARFTAEQLQWWVEHKE